MRISKTDKNYVSVFELISERNVINISFQKKAYLAKFDLCYKLRAILPFPILHFIKT